jgi:putative PIN family toxin of toxin-antitoxin system
VRIVLDTNTVVSGFLWDNAPRALIDAAIDGQILLFTCAALIEELA